MSLVMFPAAALRRMSDVRCHGNDPDLDAIAASCELDGNGPLNDLSTTHALYLLRFPPGKPLKPQGGRGWDHGGTSRPNMFEILEFLSVILEISAVVKGDLLDGCLLKIRAASSGFPLLTRS